MAASYWRWQIFEAECGNFSCARFVWYLVYKEDNTSSTGHNPNIDIWVKVNTSLGPIQGSILSNLRRNQ